MAFGRLRTSFPPLPIRASACRTRVPEVSSFHLGTVLGRRERSPGGLPPRGPGSELEPLDDMPTTNPYDEAEAGWEALIAAARQIQAAANRIKDGPRSIDGYEIERALRKHRPELMKEHLEGLRKHREENRL